MHYTSPEVYTYISKKTNDPIVEWKTCRISWTKFPIYQSDVDFYKKVSPVFNGKRYLIPTPTLCPEERQRRRLMFRNERKLYKRKCDATGESIISIYSPEKEEIVYSEKKWWSNGIDGSPFSLWYNFEKTFTEQFSKLSKTTPKLSTISESLENSDYSNICYELKSCYLCFSLAKSSNTLYTSSSRRCNSCVDVSHSVYCENSSNIVDSTYISNSHYVEKSSNCNNCIYINNCTSCSDCIWCVWLQHKKYYIFNKKFSEEEFKKKKLVVDIGSEKFQLEYSNLKAKTPKLWMNNQGAKNVFGNFSMESIDSSFCFDAFYSNNNKFIFLWGTSQDCMDVSCLQKNSQLILESGLMEKKVWL